MIGVPQGGGAPLTVRDLVVSFGGVAALGGVTFAVAPGTITSLIGPNGAGKTTAFNAITGYVRPAHGDVRFGTTQLTGFRPCDIAAQGVVRTFQKTSVFPPLTAFDNVMIGLHLRGTAGLRDVLFQRRRVRRWRSVRHAQWPSRRRSRHGSLRILSAGEVRSAAASK